MIVRFPKHKLARCKVECEGCFLCHGGLFLCSTCGGLEGALTTHCPGEPVSAFLCDEVYAGRLDYREPDGWQQRPAKHWESVAR